MGDVTEIVLMGLVVNTSVLIAAVKDGDGYLELSTHWAQGRLRKLGFTKRRVTTKASLTLVDLKSA